MASPKNPLIKKNEKIYTWTFQLDNNLLETQKQHHGWMPQEITLAFTTKVPML